MQKKLAKKAILFILLCHSFYHIVAISMQLFVQHKHVGVTTLLCQATVKHSLVPDDGRDCTLRNLADDTKLRGSSQYAGGQGCYSGGPRQTGEVG